MEEFWEEIARDITLYRPRETWICMDGERLLGYDREKIREKMGISRDCRQVEWRTMKTLTTGERALSDTLMRENFLPNTMM